MNPFWIGLVAGFLLGGVCGMVVMSLCAMSAISEARDQAVHLQADIAKRDVDPLHG